MPELARSQPLMFPLLYVLVCVSVFRWHGAEHCTKYARIGKVPALGVSLAVRVGVHFCFQWNAAQSLSKSVQSLQLMVHFAVRACVCVCVCVCVLLAAGLELNATQSRSELAVPQPLMFSLLFTFMCV